MSEGVEHPDRQPERPTRDVHTTGVIERADNHVLIVRKSDADAATGRWQFPSGRARPNESPEAAMRRIVLDQLRMEVEIVVGQPPLVENVDGKEVELRYFFCGVINGEPIGNAYAETRWVLKGQLREYEFEPISRQVVDWLLDAEG